MNLITRRAVALVCVPLVLCQSIAQAAVHSIEVTSTGNEVSVPLPPGTQEVELETQRAGNCRFGRTWGYDLSSLRMWVNGGCAGVFKVVIRDNAVPATASTEGDASSNTGAALAAMAAIAGVAILASQSNKHQNNNGYYPPPPPPPPPGPGMYPGPGMPPPGARPMVIRNASGGCLDLQGGRNRPGTPVQLWECNNRPSQMFYPTPYNELTVQGLCLEPAGRTPQVGVPVVVAPCDRSAAQRWFFSGAQIRNGQNGMCIDSYNQGRGSPVVQAFCNGGAPGQRWFW
jgi:hypothetical protein